MTGKPKKLTREQLARAQALVDAGYRLKDVAARFGVKPSQLNRYGVKRRTDLANDEVAGRCHAGARRREKKRGTCPT